MQSMDVDDRLAGQTVGLVSKDQYKQMRTDIKSGILQEKEELALNGLQEDLKNAKKKKKKKRSNAQLSFGDDLEEGEELASPSLAKKKKNPNLGTAFLVKKEWMSKETKAAIALEAKEKQAAAQKLKEEKEVKQLSLTYSLTLRPLGVGGSLNTYKTGGGEEHVIEDKPPRYFRDQQVKTTYGATVSDFLRAVQLNIKKTDTKNQSVAASSLILEADSGDHFIVPDSLTFYELENFKYDDGEQIFRFADEGPEKLGRVLHVMERSWYEASRYHFPQSSWELFETIKVDQKKYPNPSKTKAFKPVGTQDEIDQWNKSQGVQEGFVYKDSAHRSNWQR